MTAYGTLKTPDVSAGPAPFRVADPEARKVVNQLRNIELRPVPASTQNQGRIPAVVSDSNIVLPLPIIMNRSVAQVDTYAGGTANAAYSQTDTQAMMTALASLNAKVNQLLQEMTNANLNPR